MQAVIEFLQIRMQRKSGIVPFGTLPLFGLGGFALHFAGIVPARYGPGSVVTGPSLARCARYSVAPLALFKSAMPRRFAPRAGRI